MMKEILYILLDNYAEHEIGFMPGAVSTNATGFRKEPKYINKMVAPTMEPVKSIGGMRTLPDYSFETMPEDYAALVLIGGFGWMNSEAERVLPIVKDALSKGVVVGAICNAASWMAKQGLLNNIKHTGNGINQLKLWGGNNYTNEAGYVNEQAVTDGRIVTANGSGYLEFTRELLKLLENDTPEMINGWYTFMSDGLVKLYSPRPRFKFNTVGLFTSNNKATVDFYTKAFGFTTDWDGIQPNVEMMLGDMRIILYPRSDFEQMVSYKFQYPMGLNGTVELAFDVPSYADVDKEYQHALRHGAISVLPPTTEPWGQRTCYVADPDGNLIEIGSFTIALATMGVIHIVATFTPLINGGLELLSPAKQQAIIYMSLMCGMLLIVCGLLIAMLHKKVKEHPFLRRPYMLIYGDKKVKEHPFLRRPYMLIYGVLSVDGIAAVAFMPHNPFAWLVFILICCLVILFFYYDKKK